MRSPTTGERKADINIIIKAHASIIIKADIHPKRQTPKIRQGQMEGASLLRVECIYTLNAKR